MAARKKKDQLALLGQGTLDFYKPPSDALQQAGVLTRESPGYSYALTELSNLTHRDHFAGDIETFCHGMSRGPDKSALKFWQNEIRLIGLKLPNGKKICNDYGENHRGTKDIYFDPFREAFAKAISNGARFDGHNVYFDALNIRAKLNVILDNVGCSMTQSKILWAGVPNFYHDIASTAIRCGQKLHEKSYGATVDFGGQINATHKIYNVNDADLADRLVMAQQPILERVGLANIYELERYVIPAFVDMAYNGLPVNIETLHRVYEKFYQELLRLEWRIKNYASNGVLADVFESSGMGGNWIGSSRKVYKYFLDTLLGNNIRAYHISDSIIKGNPEFDYDTQETRSADGKIDGKEPTDIDIIRDFPSASSDSLLMKLVEFPKQLQEVAQDILDFRSIRVQLAYLEKIQKNTWNGRVRATYTTMAHSGNGRVSIKDPNLANSAKLKTRFKKRGLEAVRTIFQSSDPDEQQLIFDLPGAHGAAAAQVSGDPLLCAYVLEDLHSITASSMAEMQGLKHWTPEYIASRRKGGFIDSDECASLRDGAKTLFYCKLNKAGKVQVRYVLLGGDTCIRIPLTSSDPGQASAELWCKVFDKKFAQLVYTQNQIAKTAAEMSVSIGGRNYGTVYSLDGRRIFIPMYGSDVSPSQAVMQMWMSIEARLIKQCIGDRYHLIQRKNPTYGVKSENMQHDEDDFSCNSKYASVVADNYADIAKRVSAKYITKIDLASKFTGDGMLIVKDAVTNQKRRILTLNDK